MRYEGGRRLLHPWLWVALAAACSPIFAKSRAATKERTKLSLMNSLLDRLGSVPDHFVVSSVSRFYVFCET